jgi:hypothetical protein
MKNKKSITNFSVAEECYKDNPKKLELYNKQREENGFDDTETWHLDTTFALFLLPRLKRFTQVCNSFPNGETPESYRQKLSFIIKSFEEYYLNENDESTLEIEKERLQNAKNAVNILAELWFHLWW